MREWCVCESATRVWWVSDAWVMLEWRVFDVGVMAYGCAMGVWWVCDGCVKTEEYRYVKDVWRRMRRDNGGLNEGIESGVVKGGG